ncbi:MAG TPA: MFS transporter [Bacillales bacterium]|nr:MFS transporter [Bacillales bacterium]
MLSNENLLDRVGITSKISWGFLGVLIFMMGDGLELGWLSPYLIHHGLSVQQSASLFTAYGVTIAIAAWLSGVLIDVFGAKRVMLAGVIVYVIGQAAFIGLGIDDFSYWLMLPTYMIRGFGYPLFAYGFLVWIAYRTPKQRLGAAVGWFWFVFTGGMNVLGAYYSVWAIKHLGNVNTLWTAILWVVIGAIFALVFNRDKFEKKSSAKGWDQVKELVRGITIVKKEPKVGIAGIVRVINQAAQYAFPVFLPTYLEGFGIPTTTWLSIWGTIFMSNIAFNLIFGFIGDKFGWRNTVMWFGGCGCGLFTLLLYYAPQVVGGNLVVMQIIGILWGACLAGYVPLSALVPSLVKEDKGSAMSILNLGAGLCTFVGPAIVGLFFAFGGALGVTWILAGLYFVGAFLTKFVTLPNNAKTLEASENEEVMVSH